MTARIAIAFLAVLFLTVAAPTAGAQGQVNVPPGNSEVDQYFESVPSGSGNVGVRRGAGAEQGSRNLDPAAVAALEALGEDGRAVAAFANANPPRNPQDSRAAGDRAATRVTPSDAGPLPAVVEALGGRSDGNGMGVFLPLLLVSTLFGAALLVLLRRRRDA